MAEERKTSQPQDQKPSTPDRGSPPSRWQTFRPSRTWILIFLGLLVVMLSPVLAAYSQS